jgi:hypothetical protein
VIQTSGVLIDRCASLRAELSHERRSDERVPRRVRPDRLGDPRRASQSAHDPPGGVPIEPFAVVAEEDRRVDTLADGEIDRSGRPRRERDHDNLAALARHREGPVAALESKGFDVGAECF